MVLMKKPLRLRRRRSLRHPPETAHTAKKGGFDLDPPETAHTAKRKADLTFPRHFVRVK